METFTRLSLHLGKYPLGKFPLDKYALDKYPFDKCPLDKCPTTIFIFNVLYDVISERLDNPRTDGILKISTIDLLNIRPDITVCQIPLGIASA